MAGCQKSVTASDLSTHVPEFPEPVSAIKSLADTDNQFVTADSAQVDLDLKQPFIFIWASRMKHFKQFWAANQNSPESIKVHSQA